MTPLAALTARLLHSPPISALQRPRDLNSEFISHSSHCPVAPLVRHLISISYMFHIYTYILIYYDAAIDKDATCCVIG